MTEIIDLDSRVSQFVEEENSRIADEIYELLDWLKKETKCGNVHVVSLVCMNRDTGNVRFKTIGHAQVPDIMVLGALELMKAQYTSACLGEATFIDTPA